MAASRETAVRPQFWRVPLHGFRRRPRMAHSPAMSAKSGPRPLSIVVFWLLFGAISGFQIQISMLSHHHSWPLVVGYQMLVWSVWIGFSFAIAAVLARVPVLPPRAAALALHFALAVAFAVLHAALWVLVELWLVPYDFMNPTAFRPRFEKVAFVQMPLEVLLYALVVLAHVVFDASARARERERLAAQLETSLAQARLHALELQLQPHFLFNTLNGISSLVRAGHNPEAIGMIGGLSDLLRYALDRAGGARVALEEDVTMAGRYLEIQRLRFGDRLAFDVEIARDARRAAVPVLLLQPLVENAVRHGTAKSDAKGRIVVHAAREGETVKIEVWNSGRLDPHARDGIGLSTTRQRLVQTFGAAASLTLAERDGGVVTRVVLPFSEAS